MNSKALNIIISLLLMSFVLSGCTQTTSKGKKKVIFKHDTPLIKEDVKKLGKIEVEKSAEIEIPINNNEELEKKISNIEKEIKGLDFDQIILKYNNQNLNFSSSDLGWISSASLDPQINQIISQVKVGNLTKPIKRQDSIIILKLTDKRFSKKQNIDTAKLKKSFINKKKNEQFNLYSRSHLSKLKNNSLIEYK